MRLVNATDRGSNLPRGQNVILCEECENVGTEPRSIDAYPRCWERPSDWGSWVPAGPHMFVLECVECEAIWGLVRSTEALEHALLPETFASLLPKDTPFDEFLDALALEPEPGVPERCLKTIMRERLELVDPVEQVHAVLRWLEPTPRSAAVALRSMLVLNDALTRAIEDPHSKSGRSIAREQLGRRLDAGHAVADAAQLAQRDWQRSRTVFSIPQLRAVDLAPVFRLIESPPRANSDYEAGRL
ncbi:MAG: hypothetical protein AAF658_19705, partial [Myxococcota bacterium]